MKALAAVTLAWLVSAPAAQTPPMKEQEPGLSEQAKVTPESARKTALARVHKGKIQSEELERENGKLVYSFDIKEPGKPGVQEVQVDAITGVIVSSKHESAATETKEKKADHPAPPKK